MSQIIPIPKIPISIRPATLGDLPFIDSLQKKTTKQVGFMPTKQFEGKNKAGSRLNCRRIDRGFRGNERSANNTG